MSLKKIANMLILGAFSLVLVIGIIQPSPARADEEKWYLVSTGFTPGVQDETEYSSHSWSGSGTTMDHWFRYGGIQPVDNHQQFTFTRPPDVLTPGATVYLTVTGTSSGSDPTISGETFEYSAEGIVLEGNTSVSVGFGYGAGPDTATASFLVPEASSDQITITASMITALGASADGFSVQWVYAAEAPEGMNIDLTHYNPFDYFKTFDYQRPETAADIAPAGDLVARLTDKNGDPVVGKRVYFYAVKELNPDQLEPGKNLRGILKPWYSAGGPADYVIPNSVLFQALGIDEETYLMHATTDANGEARVNYLNGFNFDTEAFAQALQAQTAIHNTRGRDEGKISGTIKAVVVLDYDADSQQILELMVSLPVAIEFRALAKILKITGEGQPDDTDEGSKYPGRVRVKRVTAYPQWDNYKQVEEGFLLMAGDIVSIDGGTAVEIAWVSGEKGIAIVPSVLIVKDSELPVPQARIKLMSSAYESGFMTPLDTGAAKLAGVSIEKGIELLMVTVAGFEGKIAHFVINVFKHGEFSFEDHAITTKIRLRSRVIIDTTGEEVAVYNIEGSPDVKTIAGGEITLSSGEMATISEEGVLGAPQTFNTQAIESDFYEGAPSPAPPPVVTQPIFTLTQQPGVQTSPGSGGSGLWYFIAAGASFVWLIVLLVRRKKKRG